MAHERPQTMLMSATLSSDLEELKRAVLHSPAVLKLEDGGTDGTLSQFYVGIGRDDKYLLLYALVKLSLIRGKAIFFVNDVDRYGGTVLCDAMLSPHVSLCGCVARTRHTVQRPCVAWRVRLQLLPAEAVPGEVLHSSGSAKR